LGWLVGDPEVSSYRESLLEAIFVAELVQVCAIAKRPWVELVRGFVDFRGYDLIATAGRRPGISS
jgi:hypothetical protein